MRVVIGWLDHMRLHGGRSLRREKVRGRERKRKSAWEREREVLVIEGKRRGEKGLGERRQTSRRTCQQKWWEQGGGYRARETRGRGLPLSLRWPVILKLFFFFMG